MSSSSTTTINPGSNSDVLQKFKTPSVFYPIIFLIILLIVAIFMIMYNVKIPGSSNAPSTLKNSDIEIISNVSLILFIILIIYFICIMFLPNFKELKEFFIQTKESSYIILYTISLILFYRFMPSNIINNYAYIILPITLLIGIFIFYKGAQSNYINSFNINYERIKSLILFFCFITTIIVYYNIDPGGYTQKYLGSSLLITIIMSVFALLYVIILLTLPSSGSSATTPNLLSNFSNFSVYGSILFVIFLIVMTILISTYPGGFFKNKNISTSVIIILLLIVILWSTMLAVFLFPELSNKQIDSDKLGLFKRSLLALFGVVISGLIIYWLVYNIQQLSGATSILSFILNIIVVILIMSLIYKTINVKLPYGNSKKSAFVDMIINTIFYIPCLFSSFFETTTTFFKNQYAITTPSSVLMLVLLLIVMAIYYFIPKVYNMINLQGGKLLVNNPVSANSQMSLGTYQDLNGSETFNYEYAISSWVYINSASPNTNSSYSKYTSLINFGGKPNVLYNGSTNTLMVTMQQKNLKNVTKNKLIDFDEEGNRIIYIKNGVLLQKWNNIIINYSGGILDIFLNGELVKSDIGVVPYYTLDSLNIGEDNGILAGICNVVYYNKPLTSANIFVLYNMVKNKDPPVSMNNDITINKKKNFEQQ